MRFRDDFQAHLDGGTCPYPDSPLANVLAPVDQHAHDPVADPLATS
jgi:hypothetical protein